MNKLVVAAVSLSALAVPAVAADLSVRTPVYKAPVPPVSSNWSGFYVGGHAGFMWGRSTVFDEGNLLEKNAPTNGFVGGALAGVNWQTGAWVLGLEGDFGWTNARGNGTGGNDGGGGGGGSGGGSGGSGEETVRGNHYSFNWTSHIRGRIGYATSNVLWFVAGGVALADFDYTERVSGITTGSVFTGWTLGGGADIAINPSWIARVEYLHDDFGDKTFSINGEPYRVKLTGDTVRGALMYKF
jgi:outer membrane immunogenic protein